MNNIFLTIFWECIEETNYLRKKFLLEHSISNCRSKKKKLQSWMIFSTQKLHYQFIYFSVNRTEKTVNKILISTIQIIPSNLFVSNHRFNTIPGVNPFRPYDIVDKQNGIRGWLTSPAIRMNGKGPGLTLNDLA